MAHQLARRLSDVRKDNLLFYLLPDVTTQVAIEYRKKKPYRAHSINTVVAHQSLNEKQLKELRNEVVERVITPVFEQENVRFDDNTKVFVNPDGPFVGGGPVLHSGLTGRKNAIDLYRQYCRYSDAAVSGKDPGRIDRTGNYVTHFAAKSIVAAGLAEECEVQLSYIMSQAEPISIQVETFGAGKVPDDELTIRCYRTI